MKKASITIVLLFSTLLLIGQGGTSGNFRTGLPGQFLGHNAGTAGPLDIRNDFANQPINFWAGGTLSPFARICVIV